MSDTDWSLPTTPNSESPVRPRDIDTIINESPSKHLNLVKARLDRLVTEGRLGQNVLDLAWPRSRRKWLALKNDSVGLNEMLSNIEEAIERNFQHPIIRVAPANAHAAFRFLLPNMRPYCRTCDEVCQLCNTGENSGFHLLTSCTNSRAYEIRRDILPEDIIRSWSTYRREGGEANLARLNAFILDKEPWIRAEPWKTRDLLLIQSKGNDLDVMARLLMHYFREKDASGHLKWSERINRCGRITRSILHEKFKHPTKLSILKDDLYSAYTWVATICESLWRIYYSRDYRQQEVITVDARATNERVSATPGMEMPPTQNELEPLEPN